MAEAARRTGRVLVEPFHWRYHPPAARTLAIINSGGLDTVRHVEAHFDIPPYNITDDLA